jgi:antitoxin ChpS
MPAMIKKIYSANGIIIPKKILKKLGLIVGEKVNINEINGRILITKSKPKYTLDKLLAECDACTPMCEDLKIWDQLEPVGLEYGNT